MRVAVRGRNTQDIVPLLEDYDVQLTDDKPDIVISYGGDGALLGAERDFPGIPKCPIRDSRSNRKCEKHDERTILSQLFNNQLPRDEVCKVKGEVNGEVRGIGLNDVVIDREHLASAIRYRVSINDQLYANKIVGDGIVVATPFGSSGYYRSITHSLFTIGLGLAFNNATEVVNHLVIDQSSRISIEILRGPALFFADNDPHQTHLSEGDYINLHIAMEKAVILGLNVFRCPDCYWHRHHHSRPLVPLSDQTNRICNP